MSGTRPARKTRPAQPGGAGSGLSRPAEHLLGALAADGVFAMPDPTRDDSVLVGGGFGISLGRGSHAAKALRELDGRGLVEPSGPGRTRSVITPAGQAYLRRARAGDGDPFAAQHRELRVVEFSEPTGRDRLAVNAQESPLEWLRRRRDRAGEPLIDAGAFEAGERLRRDLTRAGMLPSVTARWDGAVGSGAAATRDPAAAADAVIAARQRVRLALEAVGGDFADLLIDLCGFLKGLETIERDRGWPPRSGKVVVRLALRRLACHYGLASEATGPDTARRLRSWSAPAEDAA